MNTKQTHTPGPWAYAHSGPVMQGYSQPFAVAQKGERNLIAGVFGDVKGGVAVTEANARLIATAPELLEALKDARFALYGDGPGNPKIDNVIAKAEGK